MNHGLGLSPRTSRSLGGALQVTVVVVGLTLGMLPPLEADSGKAPSKVSKKSESTAIQTPLIDAQKFNDTMKTLRGKVVLVNMWATWCVPCRQEFPMLVQLYKEYKPKGFEILAISNDDIQNHDDVNEFVKDEKADFRTYIIDPKGANDLREAIYPRWTGNIPSTFIFDREGKLNGEIFGTLPRADFEAMINPLLK